MSVKLLAMLFLTSLVSTKVFILDEKDLPQLLKAFSESRSKSKFRKLAEADSGVDESEKTGVADASEDNEKVEDSEKVEEVEKSEKVEESEKSEEAEESEKVEEADKSEKVEEAEESEKSDVFEEPLKESTGEPAFMPLVCYYRGESRPGFEMDGSKYVMRPQEVDECKKPKEYEVDREVLLTEEADLSDCAGIEYEYKKEGETVSDTLYVIRTSGEVETLPEVFPGYMSKMKNNVRVFMYSAVYNHRRWMGDVYVLCKKE
jgi:hypothetical protein